MESGKWMMKSNDIEVLNTFISEQKKRIDELEYQLLIRNTRIQFLEQDNNRLRDLINNNKKSI